MLTPLAILLSYLIGCFNTSYYFVRWRTGQDIRNLGSGTAGARNTGRVLGKQGFALVFLGDVLKGMIALWLARWLGVGAWALAGAMIAVVLGHLYPVQLGWRGGKGVATGFGAMLVIQPWLGLLCLVLAGIVFVVTREFTRSGIVAIVAAPLLGLLLRMPLPHWVGLTVIVLLLLYAQVGGRKKELGSGTVRQ